MIIDSFEFADLMQQLVPELRVHLVRLCDGGHLFPRAKVRLNLAGIVPDVERVPGLSALLSREVTLDLFDPPQREQIREQAVVLTAQPLTQDEIGERLPNAPTQTAVSDALNLHREMQRLGLDTPYLTLLEPPSDYTKLRRYKNRRYKFEPMEGYERPNL